MKKLWLLAPLALTPLSQFSPAAPPPPDIHGFRSWHRATKEPYSITRGMSMLCRQVSLAEIRGAAEREGPHGPHDVHIFVNTVGKAAMKPVNTVFPVGTVIVKEKYKRPVGRRWVEWEPGMEAKNAVFLTAMRKRERGFDPQNGDWEYFVGDPKAMKLTSPDMKTLKACQSCHALYKDRDFVTKTYLIGGLRRSQREVIKNPPQH